MTNNKPRTDGVKTGLAVGLNKGHIVTLRKPRFRPVSKKGRQGSRLDLVRQVIRSVTGLSPYEKRIVELIKGGGANGPKRAQRFAQKRLGTLRRTKKKITEISNMAEKTTTATTTTAPKSRTVRKYTYRGLGLEDLTALPDEKLPELFCSRQRRRYNRGLKHKYKRLITKIRKAKKGLQPGEKPKPVNTHLRNTIIIPEMVGSIVGIHCGNAFNPVEIRFDMIGTYLGEYALTYKACKHGKPGVGATKGSAHVDIK